MDLLTNSEPLSCQMCQEIMPQYWNGNVSKILGRKVEKHLAECAACDDHEDTEWMARVSIGDERAFKWLMHKHKHTAMGRIYGMTGCANGSFYVEDLFQEVWLKIWRSADKFDVRKGVFRSWCCEITLNICRDWLRRMRVRPDARYPGQNSENTNSELEKLKPDRNSPDQAAGHQEMLERLAHCASKLPVDQKAALALYRLDHTQRAIAEKLKMSLGTANNLIHGAFNAIRVCLERNGYRAEDLMIK